LLLLTFAIHEDRFCAIAVKHAIPWHPRFCPSDVIG
jgi:hypothetical protein